MDSHQNPKNFQLKTLEIKHNIEGKFKGAYTHYMEPEIHRRSPKSPENSCSPFFDSTHTHTREEERKTRKGDGVNHDGFTHHRRRWRLRGGVGQRRECRERRTDCEKRWKVLDSWEVCLMMINTVDDVGDI